MCILWAIFIIGTTLRVHLNIWYEWWRPGFSAIKFVFYELCHMVAVSGATGVVLSISLWWRHNDHDSVSNHQPHECLLNRLFRRRSKKTSKLRVTGLCAGNSPGPVNSPHKGPVTRKMFPFNDVIVLFKAQHPLEIGHPICPWVSVTTTEWQGTPIRIPI